MFDRILKPIRYIQVAGATLLGMVLLTACPGKSGHTLVPKPGMVQLPQVYIFYEKGEVPRGLASLENLSPAEEIETEVNGRIEFVALEDGPTAADTLRDRFSRVSSLVVFKGDLAQKTYLDAKLPREDSRKILFLGGAGIDKKLTADPTWYQARVDNESILRFAKELCSDSGVGSCTSLPTGVLEGTKGKESVQLRFGPTATLEQAGLKSPFIVMRISWEKLFQALTDKKLSAYTSKTLHIGPGSPYFELELDPQVKPDSSLGKNFARRRKDLQLEALRRGI